VEAASDAAIACAGQDLMVGFVGPSGSAYEFIVLESLTPRLLQPKPVCVLK